MLSELQQFDFNLAQAINGIAGGCWAPANQSVLGGASLNLLGPAQCRYSFGLQNTNVGGWTFVGQNVWPQYAAGHQGSTQTRLYPIADGYALNDPSVDAFFYAQTGTAPGPPIVPTYSITIPWTQSPFWRHRYTDTGVQVLAPFINFSDGAGFRSMQWRAPLRAFDASTLTTITVCYRVAFPPQQVPASMPLLRVVRIDSQGNVSALTSTASGADANGYVSIPRPTTAAAWYAQGQAQRLQITCDQNNAISVGTYTYALEITEVAPATGYPWALTCKSPVFAASFFKAINPNGVQTIDGVSVGNFGERVLIAGGVVPTNWTASVPFSQGALTTGANGGTTYLFRCVQSGMTGTVAPTWTNTVDSTLIDGSIVWRCLGVYNASNFISDQVGNGIWIASSGNWQRAPDMQIPSDFSQGMLVPIGDLLNGGAANGAMGSAVVQASSNILSWDPTSTPLIFVGRGSDEDEVTGAPGQFLYGHGLVWHSVGAIYTGLTQQAFD